MFELLVISMLPFESCKRLIIQVNTWYYFGLGQFQMRRTSFLSDRARFRKASLAQLMHEQDLTAAWDEYELLGGDGLLAEVNGKLPGGIYKRLAIAKSIFADFEREREWRNIARRPLAGLGVQLYVAFDGMLKDLKRKFEERMSLRLRSRSHYPFVFDYIVDNAGLRKVGIGKREFIEAVGAPLQQVTKRTLRGTMAKETFNQFVNVLFANCDFIEALFFQQHPDKVTLLNQVVPLQSSYDHSGTFIDAFRLCCKAYVGSAGQRQQAMDRLTKLGGPKMLYTLSQVCVALIMRLNSVTRPHVGTLFVLIGPSYGTTKL